MAIDLSNPGLRILPADIQTPSPASAGIGSISGVGSGEDSFGATLKEAVGDVDNLALDARYKVSNMIQSNGADVHDAMIAVENVAVTNLTNAAQSRTATLEAAAALNGATLMDYLAGSQR